MAPLTLAANTKFIPTLDSYAESARQAARLFPLSEGATKEEVSKLGSAIIERLAFDRSKIDLEPIFKDVAEKLNDTGTDLLLKQARDLYARCLNLIPSTVAKLKIPSLGKAYAARQIRIDHCGRASQNAVRDPFHKAYSLIDRLLYPQGSFAYMVGLHGNKTLAQNGTITPDESDISEQIINASGEFEPVNTDLATGGIIFLEASIDQIGNSISRQGEFTADWIGKSLSRLSFNETGECINQTGRSISQAAGQFINQYPTASPILAGYLFGFNALQAMCFPGTLRAWEFRKQSVGHSIVGFILPHLIESSYKLVHAGYNRIPNGTLEGLPQTAADVFNYGADAVTTHPWISGGSALAFASTVGHTYYKGYMFGPLSPADALYFGAVLGSVFGFGIAGAGVLANAAISSYESDKGYFAYGADAVTTHPWISGGSALAFASTVGYSYYNMFGPLLPAEALCFGVIGSAIALGVAGIGVLTNAAVSRYQSDEGYVANFVNEVNLTSTPPTPTPKMPMPKAPVPTPTLTLDVTDVQGWEAGGSLVRAKSVRNNAEENPIPSLAASGAVGGLAGRIGYVWHTTRAAFVSVPPRLKRGVETLTSMKRRSELYRAAWATGLATVSGVAVTIGAVAAGAVGLPVIAGLGYYYFAG